MLKFTCSIWKCKHKSIEKCQLMSNGFNFKQKFEMINLVCQKIRYFNVVFKSNIQNPMNITYFYIF